VLGKQALTVFHVVGVRVLDVWERRADEGGVEERVRDHEGAAVVDKRACARRLSALILDAAQTQSPKAS
jgi:hypothetical protein